MKSSDVAEQVNQLIEDIWIGLEKSGQQFTHFPLTNQQHMLLTLIIRHPDITPKELAVQMDVSKSTVSQQITKLIHGNYLIRAKGKEDKRSLTLRLAVKGIIYKQTLAAYYQQLSTIYTSNLTSQELADIVSSLQKLRQLLNHKIKV